MNRYWGVDADPSAQGRIKGGKPVAVLDIGSNSVRLVVYERLARALTPLYNEKSPCALGRGVAKTGKLAEENVQRALTAIKRFALVTSLMRVGQVHVLATSAVRDASNRESFVKAVEKIMAAPVRVLSGPEEAHYAALGVKAGIPDFSGIVGDLGGGSLELSALDDVRDRVGETHGLGVIRLQDDSNNAPEKARSLARSRLKNSLLAKRPAGGAFCAIGGTWRSLAKLHQVQRNYPLHMVQHYAAAADEMLGFCDDILAAVAQGRSIPGLETISSSRRELVPYGAAVLGEVLRRGRFDTVVFSALGVREGYLYSLLPPAQQRLDPLLQAAEEMSVLRSRSPAHAHDLIGFTDNLFSAIGIAETEAEARLRHVACYLADIGWRGHPDYRGEQSVDLIAYGSLTGVDHPGRAFLAEVLAVRYMGLKHKSVSQALLNLAGPAANARARLIGTAFRVAYPMSAAMPGVLPRTGFELIAERLVLKLPGDLGFLAGEHLANRLEQLASVAGIKASGIVVD
ncbi:MAG TPA: Ppx/GppA family phosphatase [Alphaproteobacteria bacterium]|nr:Ppx/GppA family phosphatase [Alphaproteobacteria bacterium]